jgi:type-F conjugative transfer system pilin assembly protein TrbC
MLHLLREEIIILILLASILASTSLGAEEPCCGQDVDSVNSVTERAKKQAETMIIPANLHEEEGKKAAERVDAIYRSQEFQEKIAREAEKLEGIVPGIKKVKKEQEEKRIAESEKIYFFLSSSIPDETLRSYMADLDTAREVVAVMYGLVDGIQDMENMGVWYGRLTRKNPVCVDTLENQCERYEVKIEVKPNLFRKYNITMVPAMVYVDRDKDPLQIAGDISIEEMLVQINREAKSPGLEGLIKKVRK